jgi:hypothetical protein
LQTMIASFAGFFVGACADRSKKHANKTIASWVHNASFFANFCS